MRFACQQTLTSFYAFTDLQSKTCPDKYLPVDTSWALKRLLVAALAKLTLVWCPTWLRLLKGRGLSTLRTPNGATEEVEDLVVMIFVRSIEILNITVICKRKLSTIEKSLKWKIKPLKIKITPKNCFKKLTRRWAAENRCQVASKKLRQDRVILCFSSEMPMTTFPEKSTNLKKSSKLYNFANFYFNFGFFPTFI